MEEGKQPHTNVDMYGWTVKKKGGAKQVMKTPAEKRKKRFSEYYWNNAV